MASLTQHFLPILSALRVVLSALVLIAPIVLVFLFRRALLRAEADRSRVWFGYRQNTRLLFLTTVGGWWALWDWNRPLLFSPRHLLVWPALSDPAIQQLIFWLLPIGSLAIAQTMFYSIDKSIAQLHWSRVAVLRQGFWSVVRFGIPLLLIADGFEAIFDGELQGVIWLIAALGVTLFGRVFLDRALGVNSRLLKSGELRNRALAMAEKMSVDLRRVFIVPQGKGHLLNAFAGVGSISLTDTLSHHLNQAEVDCAIAHELGHLKLRHVAKTLLTVILVFIIPAILFFGLTPRALTFRPAFDVLVTFAPFLVFYFFLRRFEYQADRESVVMYNAEVEIRSLAKLHQVAGAPFQTNRLSELFLTHPSLMRRATAIARSNGISGDRVNEILRDAEPRKKRTLRPVRV